MVAARRAMVSVPVSITFALSLPVAVSVAVTSVAAVVSVAAVAVPMAVLLLFLVRAGRPDPVRADLTWRGPRGRAVLTRQAFSVNDHVLV